MIKRAFMSRLTTMARSRSTPPSDIYLDTDANRTTGFRGGANNFPIGADYLLQGSALYRYTGSTGTEWSWSSVGIVTWSVGQQCRRVLIPTGVAG